MSDEDNIGALSDGSPLPEICQEILDESILNQLVVDIETCTQLLEVIPKYGPDTYVEDGAKVGLRDAVSMLLSGQLRGAQIRYVHEGSQWWDTLMATPAGVRLVRIKHDF